MFSATRYVVTGFIVALLGGVLLTAAQTRPAALPGAASGDPGTFSPTGSLAEPREGHTATLLADGRVLVAGGYLGWRQPGIATAEVWDPGTGTFSPAGSLAGPRRGHSATRLRDGRVLVVGGQADISNSCCNDLTSAEVWDPSTGAFSPAGSSALGDISSLTLLADGRVLVVGRVDTGDDREEYRGPASAEIWDPATDTFSPVDVDLGTDYNNATLLADGRVLIIDDEDPTEFGYRGSAVVWDPVTDTVEPAGSPGLIYRVSSTLLADSRVLVIDDFGEYTEGGCAVLPGATSDCISSAEVWDPATGTFGPAGTLPGADRGDFTLTALADGRALITGGCNGNGMDSGCYNFFDSAEVWDPETQTFLPTGSLAEARFHHTATALPDGRVLVVGGVQASYAGAHGSAEVWEPGDR